MALDRQPSVGSHSDGFCSRHGRQAPVSRQSCQDSAGFAPDSSWFDSGRINQNGAAEPAPLIYDIFEGTAEIQQLVVSRAISGVHIK
jgi:hypothetical protein